MFLHYWRLYGAADCIGSDLRWVSKVTAGPEFQRIVPDEDRDEEGERVAGNRERRMVRGGSADTAEDS